MISLKNKRNKKSKKPQNQVPPLLLHMILQNPLLPKMIQKSLLQKINLMINPNQKILTKTLEDTEVDQGVEVEGQGADLEADLTEEDQKVDREKDDREADPEEEDQEVGLEIEEIDRIILTKEIDHEIDPEIGQEENLILDRLIVNEPEKMY